MKFGVKSVKVARILLYVSREVVERELGRIAGVAVVIPYRKYLFLN